MIDLPSNPLADEHLVAYIDDELSPQQRASVDAALQQQPQLAERLELLRGSELPFRQSFDSLLAEAPRERLQAMLDNLQPSKPAARPLGRRRFLAVAASCMLAGVLADRLFLALRTPAPVSRGWRGVVAEYMALYTEQTLENLSPDIAAQNRQLASVGQRLGLPLDAERVDLLRPQLKRAQILEYDGVPIAQITYLDPQFGPLALCITGNAQSTPTQGSEQRLGMNVEFWSSNRHAFMLIGHNPPDELRNLAERLRQRLPT
ncbi:anti-sigma factor [Pseudomonas sp. Pseusp122]|uniref:anti-sigma factor family protein n=1 Tax=unclassified Pseudomonas TaxID=196821 RepID=UPI0039A7283D